MIYVNGRFLLQNLTGVNRFAYELCRAWTQMNISFTLCRPPGRIRDCYDISNFRIVVCGCGKSHIWEQLFLPYWFNRLKGEKVLVCFTGLGPLLSRKKMMTIHDLAFMASPKWYSLTYRTWYRLMTPLCAATSLKIITVSHFSKSEIIRRLSIDEKKIIVIYNAVAPQFCLPAAKAQVSREKCEPYVLAVSSIDPRKNFAILLKAFSHVKSSNLKLYIVGGQDSIYSTSISQLAYANSSERIKWLGRVSDAELKQYYSNALCFIYPSLYEGFGIPPLEAMACHTPTIVSDIPVLNEVCGEASLYIDPNDELDISSKIDLLANDKTLQCEMVKKGCSRCSLFDWHRSASVLAKEIGMFFQKGII